MSIQLLTEEVASKIAAGEVTERPASVVKELVENSLDAQASTIAVDIQGGGLDRILVADNGYGIEKTDVPLVFERFATSKLSQADDLETIATFGFRGEALPSIAAVSQLELITRTPDSTSGSKIEIDQGKVIEIGSQGSSFGTSVTIQHLFRNFPARRKFLRSPKSEASRIQKLISKFALAHPEVAFALTMEGTQSLLTSGSGNLREVIAEIYSTRVAAAMLELEWDNTEPMVSPRGLIGVASVARSNREHMSIFVNGRWIQNRALSYALQEAYKGFLMERRYPLAIVDLQIPYDQVDVNVHPSKTEVRFQDEGSIFSILQRSVRQTLLGETPVPEFNRPVQNQKPTSIPQANLEAFWPEVQPDLEASNSPKPEISHSENHFPLNERSRSLIPKGALPALRVLGQIQATYLIAEGPEGMYLIDQHAAHERILFELITAEVTSQSPKIQGLMEPVTTNLNSLQAEILHSQKDTISGLGFLVEEFGETSYVIRGVPAVMTNQDPASGLVDILDLMADGGGYESWEQRAAYSLACHSAIRAGKVLVQKEMSELVRELEQCHQPHTCPHGRPTMIHMSAAHLEKAFGRRG